MGVCGVFEKGGLPQAEIRLEFKTWRIVKFQIRIQNSATGEICGHLNANFGFHDGPCGACRDAPLDFRRATSAVPPPSTEAAWPENVATGGNDADLLFVTPGGFPPPSRDLRSLSGVCGVFLFARGFSRVVAATGIEFCGDDVSSFAKYGTWWTEEGIHWPGGSVHDRLDGPFPVWYFYGSNEIYSKIYGTA